MGKEHTRALGTNPRSLGTNPRALGTNPKAIAARRKAEAERVEAAPLSTLIREKFGVMRTPVVTLAVWQWFTSVASTGAVPSLNDYAARWMCTQRTAARHAGYMRTLFGDDWRDLVPPLVAKVKGDVSSPSAFVASLTLVATRRIA